MTERIVELNLTNMRKAGGGNFEQRRFSLPAGLKLSSACETLLQVVPSPRFMSVSKPSNVRYSGFLVFVYSF